MTRREHEIIDKKNIESILDTCMYLHLGLSSDDTPYVVTLNYGYEWDEADEHLVLFLHCSRNAYLLDIIDKNPKCGFTMECNVKPFSGPMPCRNGMAYESIMGAGKIKALESLDERIHGLKRIMRVQTGKDDFNFDERMVSIVKVLRVDVDSMRAKKRDLPEALR